MSKVAIQTLAAVAVISSLVAIDEAVKKKPEPEAPKNVAVGKDSKHHTGTSYNGPKKPKLEHRIKGQLHVLDKPMTRAALKRKLRREAEEA